MNLRTDLALEAKQIWEGTAGGKRAPEGVSVREETINGFPATRVKIESREGEKVLCKPKGTYATLELDTYIRREDEAFGRGAGAVARVLREMAALRDGDSVLVACLGNERITPDAIGPRTAEYVIATRHLSEELRASFPGFRSVAVAETGVLGTTGIESAELVRAVTEKLRPSCVIAVDALAAMSVRRLCRTIQLADTGIVPGSGVGNNRAALNRDSLGVSVIAIGVPTVVDAATLAAEMTGSSSGGADRREDPEYPSMIVTPREIDVRVEEIAKLIGYGINLALHDGLTVEDVNLFVS